jgi:hypothetical protein
MHARSLKKVLFLLQSGLKWIEVKKECNKMIFYIAKCIFLQIVQSRTVSSKNRVFPRRIWNSLLVVMLTYFSAENVTFIWLFSCDMQNCWGNFSEIYEMQYNKYIADCLFKRVRFSYLEKHYNQACFWVITPQDLLPHWVIDPEVDFIVVSCFMVILCVTSRPAFRCSFVS